MTETSEKRGHILLEIIMAWLEPGQILCRFADVTLRIFHVIALYFWACEADPEQKDAAPLNNRAGLLSSCIWEKGGD
jgi:hypothetical protein